MTRVIIFLVSLLLSAVTAVGRTSEDSDPRASTEEAEPVAFQIHASPPSEDKAIEDRTFYTSSFGWYFQAASVLGSLSMRGYDSTDNGGTITRVTGCFYNESAFQRTFRATLSVVQFGTTVQSITFSRSFPSMRSTCHTLTGFNAAVEPGEYEIVASYQRNAVENFWLGLSVTTRGQTFDVQVGSQRPPTVTGSQGPITVRGVGIGYRIDVSEGPSTPPGESLSTAAGLIVPGFEVEADDPEGPTLQFAVRNTTDTTIEIDISYYGNRVATPPLRTDVMTLEPQATTAWDVRFDLSDLNHVDGFATGLAIITEAGETTARNLEGDYFRIDSRNDFATGNRLIRPSDFCDLQEARIVDFGSGTQFRILTNQPPGDTSVPSFLYTVYDFAGTMIGSGDYFTSDHLTVLDATDLGIEQAFGTILFDFSNSFGGWVSSRYSAFDRFSAEIPSACRDAE